MNLIGTKMTRELAKKIMSWQYEPPYDLYNNEFSEESIKELMDEGYIAVKDDTGSLIGFYCTDASAQVPAGRGIGVYSEPAIDIGIGMIPELTGKGHGFHFLSFVLKEVEGGNNNQSIRLTVAAFNRRAIKLYENLGFNKVSEFRNEINEFITMVKR